MLSEFADVGAAEAPVGAGLAFGVWDQMGEVGFDVGLHRGSSAIEVVQARIGCERRLAHQISREFANAPVTGA